MQEILETLTEIKPLVDNYIEKILPRKGTPQILYEGSWKYLEYGGKRWRPALLVLACKALNGKTEQAIPTAAALEIAHTFFLVHDDIEDYSNIRRGQPTLHVQYGIPHAINMGDFLFMKVYEALLSGKNLWGPEKTMKILGLFSEMFKETAEGQAMEIEQRDKDLSEASFEWYKTMSLKKTGFYSGGVPCSVGAVIAGGTEKQIEAMRKFGFGIGIAFQIQDDIINVTMAESDEKVAPGTTGGSVGKDFAGDLAEGKRTLMIVHLYEHANKKEREKLSKLIGNQKITLKEKRYIIDLMQKYGSIDYAKNYAKGILKKELNDLQKHIPKSDGRSKLEGLANFLVERNF